MTLSDMCRRLELPMTTVHRLLVTLWRSGVLERDRKRRYILGARLVALVGNPDAGDDAS